MIKKKMKIIENALKKAISYTDYRYLVKELLAEHKSTTKKGGDSLVQYSKLNDKRMDRLDKKGELPNQLIKKLKEIKQMQIWLVITEGWCGDAAQNLPYIYKMTEVNSQIELKLVLRDENVDLMNLFLTNGSKAIPKLIALNTSNEVLFTWGPRPSIATKMVQDEKTRKGLLDTDFKTALQVWYNKNKGQNLTADFAELITPYVTSIPNNLS